MIHILLLILKIIGSLLLVILGILVFLALAVLFVPVRYEIRGAWHSRLELCAGVNWFFHVVSVRVLYQKDGLKTVLRVFGFRLFKNRDRDVAEDIKEKAGEILSEEGRALSDELKEDETHYREGGEQEISGKREGFLEDEEGEPGKEKAPQGKILSSLQWFKTKLYRIWKKLRFSFLSLCGKLKGMSEFIRDKKEWLEDEKNQASIKLLFRQVKKLIAHLWPVKGRGTVTFGFDDPYTTGQVLQVMSLVYPFYHRQLDIHPVFDQQVIDAEGSFRGRIRLAVVAWLTIRVFLDRHTRRMIRGFIK